MADRLPTGCFRYSVAEAILESLAKAARSGACPRTRAPPAIRAPSQSGSSSKRKGRPRAAEVETTAEDIESSIISGNTGPGAGGVERLSLFIRLRLLSSQRESLSRGSILHQSSRGIRKCHPILPRKSRAAPL